jgi:hypothetical protein
MSNHISNCRDIFCVCVAVRAMVPMRIYCLLIFIMRKRFDCCETAVVQQRKFIPGCCIERALFCVCPAYPKISVHPSCDFCIAHRYRKINKGRRAVSCEASEGLDSGFTGLLHLSDVSRLQPSLLRFRLMWLRTFQF